MGQETFGGEAEQNKKENSAMNPIFIFESVDDLINRIQELGFSIPDAAEDTLANIVIANKTMTTTVFSNNHTSLNATYTTYIHLLSEITNNEKLWDTLPEYIPFDEEDRVFFQKDSIEYLKGEPREIIRSTLRTYINELKKVYNFRDNKRDN